MKSSPRDMFSAFARAKSLNSVVKTMLNYRRVLSSLKWGIPYYSDDGGDEGGRICTIFVNLVESFGELSISFSKKGNECDASFFMRIVFSLPENPEIYQKSFEFPSLNRIKSEANIIKWVKLMRLFNSLYGKTIRTAEKEFEKEFVARVTLSHKL